MVFAIGQLLIAGAAVTAALAAREKVVQEHNPGNGDCPSDTVQAFKAMEKDFIASAGPAFREGPPCMEECPEELPAKLRETLGVWLQKCSRDTFQVYPPVPERCAGTAASTTGLMAELDSEVVQLVSCNPAYDPYRSIAEDIGKDCSDATQQVVAEMSAWMQTRMHGEALPGQAQTAASEAEEATEFLMQASPSLMEVTESHKQTDKSDNWPLYWNALDLSPNLQDCVFTVPMAAFLTVAANAGLLAVGFNAVVGLYKVITNNGALDPAGQKRGRELSAEPAEAEGDAQFKRARKGGGRKVRFADSRGKRSEETKTGAKAKAKLNVGRARDDAGMED